MNGDDDFRAKMLSYMTMSDDNCSVNKRQFRMKLCALNLFYLLLIEYHSIPNSDSVN